MNIYEQLTYINNSSLALGFFDGLHLGHKVVLKNTVNIAKEFKTNSTVITFKNHPLECLYNKSVEQILTVDEKLKILSDLGIDNVFLLDFNEISSIKADDYIKNILVKYFSPIAITTGFNHSFGYNREGNSQFLRDKSTKYGYKYYEIPPFVVNGDVVSCSVIRNKLQLGNFFEANKLLGYNFFISGIVIQGDKIAAELGFPSANIVYPENKIKIPLGVYYVKVDINGILYDGVLNYGYCNNKQNNQVLKTEVHILNYNNNLYGKPITIQFIAKIRNQITFENTDKLKAQIIRDIAFCEIYKHFIIGYIKKQ